ncbi:MAG TPA: hypothetical protein EYG86_01470 [Crocinitomicaceae bacterium]|nr:hypothetical protein [Crocinitomicaceae bacterium]
MYKGIIIYLSILAGLALTVGGSYFIIDNLKEPQGLLFEGIIATALGITLLMVLVVATTIGKAIMLFGDILEQTIKLNQEIIKHRQLSPNLSNFFQNIMPGSMTIADLESGGTKNSLINPNSPGELGKMSEMIMNAMNETPDSKKNKELKDMTDKQLQSILAKALKTDDFEKAAEVQVILKERRKPDSGEDENTSE